MFIQNYSEFSNQLIPWYLTNKRDLPWRDITDPYQIWISEIILQQTRVNQGLNYYLRFIERFPTISVLAAASENEVLNYWQGLGYYTRARNLHATAKILSEQYNNNFPLDFNQILSLPGIGTYTASAIASFAYNQPFAVVDGNVYRVLSRIFGLETPIDSTFGKVEFTELANSLLPNDNSATYNQAIMEFGAMQCVPISPQCEICPLLSICVANKKNKVNLLPVKEKKTKVKNRFLNYFYIEYDNSLYMKKRSGKDVWKNLYEFPLIETLESIEIKQIFILSEFKSLFQNIDNVIISSNVYEVKHVLSHQIIHAKFYNISIDSDNDYIRSNFKKIPFQMVSQYPVSRLIEKYLQFIDTKNSR